MKKRSGFTLIELIIVIVIISILATIVIISYSGAQIRARDSRRKADMQSYSAALNMFYADYKKYPRGASDNDGGSTEAYVPMNLIDTGNFDIKFLEGKYISDMPSDPLQINEITGACRYLYLAEKVSGSRQDYKIISTNPELLNDLSDTDKCKSIAGDYFDPIYPCGTYQISTSSNSREWKLDPSFYSKDRFTAGCPLVE